MKILMFGRGVIATQYAWALEKAGNTVEFYVRPGRIAQYGPFVNLEIIDARKKRKLVEEKWHVVLREELEVNHDYDLIIVSVNHNQLEEVINFIAPLVGKATVLMFNNLWIEPDKAVALLPKEQVVWGFPGAGGGYSAVNTLKGGFMKIIYLGFVGERQATKRYQSVRALFENAGFSISEQKDMRSWLWIHFTMNAGLAAEALKLGGYDHVFDSRANLKEGLLLMREMLPLIKAKGGKVSALTILAMHLPAGLTGYIMEKVMAKGKLLRDIMEGMTSNNPINYEATSFFPRDVLTDARRLELSLPRLTALESLFVDKQKDTAI